MKKYIKEIFYWTFYAFIVMGIILAINIFGVQLTQVKGKSMELTLHNNQYIIINKLPHTFKKEFKYGDIIVVDSRLQIDRTLKEEIMSSLKASLIAKFFIEQENYYWIKRVIGKEGDTIEFKDGKVIRNGETLNETYTYESNNEYLEQKIIVPKKSYYILGDNRVKSKDSRHIGCVPEDHIIGKYLMKMF